MNKKLLFVILISIISRRATAQQQLFVGVQSGWGGGLTSIESKGSILKSKSIAWQINTGLALQYRIAKVFAIEVGASLDNSIWKTYDKDFKNRYDSRFETNIKNKIGSPSFFVNLQYAFKLPEGYFDKGNYIYIQLGGGYHQYGEQSLSEEKSLVKDGNIVETMNMNTRYSQGSYFFAPEIGFLKLNKSNNMSVGLMGAFNLNNVLSTSNYTVTKSDGSLQSSDKLTNSGNYIGINLKFNLSVFHKEKKEKKVKEKTVKQPKEKKEKVKKEKVEKPKKEKVKKTKEVVPPTVDTTKKTTPVVDTIVTTPVVDTIVRQPAPDTVQLSEKGRNYTIDSTIVVSDNHIIIYAWDNMKIDGDRINLSFNGKWILKNYTLTGTRKIIKVKLKEGSNHLVLYALNLGEYPPNTAAIQVFDNEKFQEIILNSTLEKSGALEIIYKPEVK